MKQCILMLAGLLALTSCDYLLEDDDPDEEIVNNGDNDSNDGNGNGGNNSSTDEAQATFKLINAVRANPSAYSSQMGVSLSGVEAKSALAWSSALAKVAQDKAEDMANNNYFSHTDLNGYGINYYMYKAGYDIPESWYSDKSSNFFENIAAGHATGAETVKQLIYDSGASNANAGHRASLLGISDWSSNCTDIGIGYAYNANSTYKHYWSIIIAKHNY